MNRQWSGTDIIEFNSLAKDIKRNEHKKTKDGIKWVSSRQNLSSGFATKKDTNRPTQLKKLDRGLKFRVEKLEILFKTNKMSRPTKVKADKQ